jgi:hypothetical protein
MVGASVLGPPSGGVGMVRWPVVAGGLAVSVAVWLVSRPLPKAKISIRPGLRARWQLRVIAGPVRVAVIRVAIVCHSYLLSEPLHRTILDTRRKFPRDPLSGARSP